MKLRAPRCSEALSRTSLPACQLSQATGGGCSATAASAAAAGTAVSSSGTPQRARTKLVNLGMERDSFGHRLDRIETRTGIERHQQEKSEVRHCERARKGDVYTLRRLQAEVH